MCDSPYGFSFSVSFGLRQILTGILFLFRPCQRGALLQFQMSDRVGSQSLVATAMAQVSVMEERGISLSETLKFESHVFLVILTFFSVVPIL